MDPSRGTTRSRSAGLFAALICVALGAAGASAVLYATPNGAGLSPDSAIYILAARQFAAGHGLLTTDERGQLAAMTWYPPLYPVLLSAGAIFGTDPLVAARYLGAICFALAVAMTVLVTRHVTRSLRAAGFAGLLVLLSPLLRVHCWAWSEPPFILFTFAGLSLLGIALERGSRPVLMVSALLVAAAAETRYIGAILPPLCILAIVLLDERRWRRRLVDSLLFLVVSSAPIALWIVRNVTLGVRTSGRALDYHPVSDRRLVQLAKTLTGWILPPSRPYWTITGLLIATGLVILLWNLLFQRRRLMERIRDGSGGCIAAILLAFALAYIPAVVGSITFVDKLIPLSDRILSPIFIPIVVVLVRVGHRAWMGQNGGGQARPLIRIGLAIMLAALLVQSALKSRRAVVAVREHGLEYNSPEWRNSRAIAWIGTLAPETPLYTNGADAVYLLTSRMVRRLPMREEIANGGHSALSDLRADVKDRGAYIIYFDLIKRKYYPSSAELLRDLDLRQIRPELDAVVLCAKRPAQSRPAYAPGH